MASDSVRRSGRVSKAPKRSDFVDLDLFLLSGDEEVDLASLAFLEHRDGDSELDDPLQAIFDNQARDEVTSENESEASEEERYCFVILSFCWAWD